MDSHCGLAQHQSAGGAGEEVGGAVRLGFGLAVGQILVEEARAAARHLAPLATPLLSSSVDVREILRQDQDKL